MTPPAIRPGRQQSAATSSEPYCGNCGYILTGSTESAKCPECGKPLVEVLQRPGPRWASRSKRYRSPATILGMPAIDIAIGPDVDEPKGRARGFLAIGDTATGVVALGGNARGVVAMGGFSMGLISAGGMSMGLGVSVGGFALGGVAAGGAAMGGIAKGGGAAGYIADGGAAIGHIVRGGGAYGTHVWSPAGASQVARDTFTSAEWFFGSFPPTALSLFQGFIVTTAVVIGLAAILALFAWVVDRSARASDDALSR